MTTSERKKSDINWDAGTIFYIPVCPVRVGGSLGGGLNLKRDADVDEEHFCFKMPD